MEIQELAPEHFERLKTFTDQEIGTGYFDTQEFPEILEKSQKGDLVCSFVAVEGEELAACRLTYAPGTWVEGARGVSPHLWPCGEEEMGYFKSLFVSSHFQQKGLGKTLSSKSIEVLKQMGAKAVLCHSWMQSPGNSSLIYLKKMGFQPIREHLKYWEPVDYECPVCGADQRCQCTALEMALELS